MPYLKPFCLTKMYMANWPTGWLNNSLENETRTIGFVDAFFELNNFTVTAIYFAAGMDAAT